MNICGKCGREPWDGKCNLLLAADFKAIVEPVQNAQTRRNCGHPAIGESPLIIEAAERNLEIRRRKEHFDARFIEQDGLVYLKGTKECIGFMYHGQVTEPKPKPYRE